MIMSKNNITILYLDLATSEVIQTDGYTMFLRKDNIIQLQIHEHFFVELKDAMLILEDITKLSNGHKYPLLVIYADDTSFSNETRVYISKHTLTKADALVSKSLALRIIGNFYIKMNKPIRPTKLFNDADDAITWLQTFT